MRDKITEEFNNKNGQDAVRLNKYLSEAGVCSRREADRLIEAGRVTVDGEVAGLGTKVNENQTVLVNKKPVERQEKMILIAVNKPVGVVCTSQKKDKNNIIDFLKYPQRIYPIGRLDKDSEGLLLMTNNGDIVNKIMRAGNYHEKEYIVTINRPITPNFIKKMSEGIPILDTVTRPCVVEAIGKYKFKIILTQGLNRQIRRMCEYLDFTVTSLKRVRVMNIHLGHLRPGGFRKLTVDELNTLYSMIENSSNETIMTEER
jgi:23S rRNA pseudouridine2604 synthase